MIFNFVVRRLHWMSCSPLAPQVFDAGLLVRTALFDRNAMRALEAFEQAALRLPSVTICVHRYGGTGFVRAGHEIAHIHSNGLLDVEVTREVAENLIAGDAAQPHHLFGRSRWISFWLKSVSDVDHAIALLRLACPDTGDVLADSRTAEPLGAR